MNRHPLLWLAVLAPAALYALWDAARLARAATSGRSALESHATLQSMYWALAEGACGLALGCHAARLARQSWKVHGAKRPHPPGHCAHCGYDLRATPARCPECGTVATMFP